MVFAIGAALGAMVASAKNPALPIPCATGACGSAGPSKFITGGAANAVATANSLTVNQTTNTAILNWSSFNIGAGGTVTFKQPGASSIALNRIFQASPSQIFGSLNANGQVYLLNLNGFLFGPTSTVNVGGLLVSSLPLSLTDANFANGILSPLQNTNGQNAVFDATLDPLAPGVGRASVLDANGNPVLDANGKPQAVQITVQSGAKITAADQGRLLLGGQSVTNGGALTAPDGQVILAAGSKIYLQADRDPGLRGLIVEVDANAKNVAWNQLTGTLSSPRGNVTMVGMAVNQDGRISATTSVSANGSIRLEAAQGASVLGSSGDQTVASTQGGALTIGPHSEMEILPELSSTATAVAAQTQLPSTITLLGEQVILQGGSIVAPGGTLTAIAAANPSAAAVPVSPTSTVITGVPSVEDPNARLRVDSGTNIDLSGSDASLPASSTLVAVQLRSSELADDPTQRDGSLHGLTVYVDSRLPSPPIANLSADFAAVPQNIAQRTEGGGKAVLQSEGDVVFAKGASLNVSGGSTTYAGGVQQTSYLIGANGKLYPIETANPLLSYVGVLNPTFSQTYNKWGVQDVLPTPGLSSYQPGYVQGASAGSVQFVAPTMALQGTLKGSAVNGLYQRTPTTVVSGGQLIIGTPLGAADTRANPLLDYVAPAVRLTNSPIPLVVADDTALPGPQTLDLPLAYLTGSGFTSTQIYSNYGVTLPAATPLVLAPGSMLSVSAARVDLLSSITDSGGSLSFQNIYTLGSLNATPRPGVYVGDDVTLDVRGMWTNDMPFARLGQISMAQTWQSGGSISLGVATTGALLSLGNNDALRTSGGAWTQSGGTLMAGTGGSISLRADAVNAGFDVGKNLAIDGFGVNGAAGGTFDLSAPRISIGGGAGNWIGAQHVDDALVPGGVLGVTSGLFADYGFETISLNAFGLVDSTAANADLLTVEAGTTINATVRSLNLKPGSALQSSATTLDGLATVTTLAPYLRPAARVSLNALPPTSGPNPASNTAQSGTSAGDISIGTGASITTDAGGSISLTGIDSIIVNGTLRAPGGNVALHVGLPDELFEVGFLPNQRIELGSAGVIDVSGTLVSKPSTLGLSLGTLYAGGTVHLFADRGAVLTDAGSSISVSGTSAVFDVAQADGAYGHEVASTAGGSIAVHSGESISLLGNIHAAAGAAGTSGPAAAGSLDLALTRTESWWGVNGITASNTFNQFPMTVELLSSVTGLSASPAGTNQAVLGAAQLTQWGLDALRIEAGDVVELSGNLALALGRQLTIDSPIVSVTGGSKVSLSAPYLGVGYSDPRQLGNSNPASGGSGAVTLHGNEIDLQGATVFQGTSNVRFASSGDLKLLGEPLAGQKSLQGSLTVAGNLWLDAARIYPTTATRFAINVERAAGTSSSVIIGQTSANPGAPLSAGGALSIAADSIATTGTIYAPFGAISLDAGTNLTLGDGSLTSISGAGLVVPYGQTQLGGEQWIYQSPGSVPQTINGVPSRVVSLQAPNITTSKQATVDLSGGGDLSAFEWVPGSGGTLDRLTSDPSVAGYAPGLYAILPSTRGQASPQDPQNTTSSLIGSGESVYLSGGGGLAAGFYPLLPARYALVPGAFLIQVEPQLHSISSGSLGALADGTPIVAGFLSYGSTGLHQTPAYTGFAIHPGSYGSQLAQYEQHSASTYFSAAAAAAGAARPPLPADAGTFSLNVTHAASNSLDLQGQVRTAAAGGGLAAPIEITAVDLVVGMATGAVPADAVSVSGSLIANWQPGALLLGGVTSADGSTIDVISNTVTVGVGTTLAAGQIAVVANRSIDVQSGATLQSTSAAAGTASATAPARQSISLVGSTGSTPALLAVSDLNWLIPVRSGGTASAGAATVTVDAGGTLASRGSLSVDGLGGVDLNGSLIGSGAEWSLGSSSIAFVPIGAQADALSLNPGLVSQLNAASAVRLASTGSIDVYAPVALGTNASGALILKSLTLEASSLTNEAGASAAGPIAAPANIQFGAQTLVLEGSGAAASPATAGPAGAILSLVASELDIGPNAFAVNGFASTRATLSGAVIGRGTGAFDVGGDLSIAGAGVTAAPGAQSDIKATGALSVTHAANAASGKLPTLLGGALALSGSTLDISGTVSAPSGIIDLVAGGALTVHAGALVSTAGTRVTIGNQSVGTPGGNVAMTAGTNLWLASGATVDVSGAAASGGGTLALTAGQSANVGSTLKGGAAGAGGASFSLDAGSLGAASGAGSSTLDLLASSLGAGGFDDSIGVRVHNGDLNLDAGKSLSANAVTLTADSGRVTVGGTITADSAALRGSLSLFGGAGVVVDGTLHADGGTSGRGGTIEIGAGQLIKDPNGLLDAYNGASIQLSGSSISTVGINGNGMLLLRAPALAVTNDVAIGSLASTTLTGVAQVTVVPVLPYNTGDSTIFSNSTTPPSADFQQVQQNVQNYMAAAGPAIAGRLGAHGAPLVIEPGVEVIAPGSLTLQSADGVSPALDLSSWRFNGAPVDLTIRATGDLVVANTVSDGFGSAMLGNLAQPILLSGLSSSIHLVAGADTNSANALEVIGGGGTLTLGSTAPGAVAAVVRTGTGSIDLIAAKDIVIGNAGSGAYTAGTPAVAAGGITADPYPDFPGRAGTEQFASDASGNPYGYAVLVPRTNSLMSFPTAGGDLTVRAGEDILGAALTTPAVSVWQIREGGTNSKLALPAWGVNLAAYDWNFGTLGGGDLNIAAGRNALNVTAATADSLLPLYAGAAQYVRGGGLVFSAGHDIGSAQVFLADGTGSVAAGGALTAVLPSLTAGEPNVGSGFYLQSSTLSVTARQGIALDGVFNPTAFLQANATGSSPLSGSYFSYSDDSSLNLRSVAGDVNLGQASSAASTLLGLAEVNLPGSILGAGVFPGSLFAQALNGDISIGPGIGNNGSVILFPSPQGQLQLLAANNIAGGGGFLAMSDAVSGSYATVATPLSTQPVGGATAAFNGDIHAADSQPALLTAGGSISDLTLSLPKAAQVVAGKDIMDLTYQGQNLNPNDQTVLMAGRDFVFSSAGESVSVGGPGQLDILAGRNVSLGLSITGIITTGNLANANLPTAQGADLTIATGLGSSADFAGFLSKIIAPSKANQAALIGYVESLQGSSGLSFAPAESAFEKLTPDEQRSLIDQVFFNELSLSGLAANTVPGAGFKEGYAAIDALFPGSRTASTGAVAGSYAGDLTLDFSRIYTLSGGNINLVVPGGLIDVGLANPPGTLALRPASTLGIVAQGPGDVNIYSRGDVNVNASRIFTLGGGDILIWSDEGSIDAGRGAKTAVSAPPPSVLINSDGTVSIDFSGAAAGSGIRTIQTNPGVAPGNVDLVAPTGTVNAGDAGIGSAGNINIAARSVVGLDNIQFGGTASGVPAQLNSIGASLSGASAAAGSASNTSTASAASNAAEKEAAAPLSQAALSWLDVFVTGLGEDNCKPNDIECLKRQKTPAN